MAGDALDYVIETDGLTRHYGAISAVDDLALRVPRGGVFGLLGPNGSGKTTTISMLLGLVHPTSGTFRLFGEDATRDQRRALRRMGAIVDGPAFYPHLTGRENLRYFQRIGRRGEPGEISRLLELVGLAERADSRYATYSTGMRQRLGIAYALLGDPELLFLDEPTNGLDPAGVVDVRHLIANLGNGDRTVVLCSHMLHEVEQVCDRVAILSRGRLVVAGAVRDLLRERGAQSIRTTDDDRALHVLRGEDWIARVTESDGHLLVDAPPDCAADITRALAVAGIYVTEMMPARQSLERFFLEVTGQAEAPAKVAS